jgi:L-seryl-tRNA(Ser) seleniumtransferase
MVSCLVSTRNRGTKMSDRRAIPSIDRLLDRPRLAAAIAHHGRPAVTDAARRAAEAWRTRTDDTAGARTTDDVASWMESAVVSDLDARLAPSLRHIINATGVVIHTNLGRAPLAAEAIEQMGRIAGGYTNLEYDLDAGARGHRHVHAERLLVDLTGAEAALVVNNNAAAALVTLAALAAGREVIVSRGELVEIGGGFRVPDVLAQSGAVLREVGTTNRTRVADYAAAIGDRTALLLRVHPSNFRIEGFTERPDIADLAAIAHRFNLPLVEDLGSGWLGVDEPPPSLAREPAVRASLAAGCDVVTFSGDKLLGGPQAGIIVGRRDLVATIGRHPLMRAVRADKLVYAALEATLALWARGPARRQIPVVAMIETTTAELSARAAALVSRLNGDGSISCEIRDGASTPGGGSAPGETIPTVLVAVRAAGQSVASFHDRLRRAPTPVVARIEDDRVLLDVRTIRETELDDLAASIRYAGLSVK